MSQSLFCRWVPVLAALTSITKSPSAAVLNISHPCGVTDAPDNTLAAFTHSPGVTDLLETDAQITGEGKFVIFLDLTVDRTTDGTMDDIALWQRALTQTEIQSSCNGGQAGQSLGDLLIQPTRLLRITSIKLTPPGAHREMNFLNQEPW